MNPEPFNVALTSASLILAAGLLAALLAVVLTLGLLVGRRAGRLEAERGLADRIAAEREDAVKRSRAVLGDSRRSRRHPTCRVSPRTPGTSGSSASPWTSWPSSGHPGARSGRSSSWR
ncbi:MAG: hypothetical protein M0C28_25620 [Candidatus Moduliflexus flocculans]|nr:hypothetical protein [Candidatus Moduliflexus flocculans]